MWECIDNPKCLLCARSAVVRTDIGHLCWLCHNEVNRMQVWLLHEMQWRPMSKDERRAHEQHVNG